MTVSTDSVLERLGLPTDARVLLLHADDFGMAHSVNRGTIDALENGWITSASIMVPTAWFPEAAAWARAHPEADLGIHLVLTSEWPTFRWRPVNRTSASSLVDDSGFFPQEPTTVRGQATRADVVEELRAQIEAARVAGVNITHLDTHMLTLFQDPVLFSVYADLGREYGYPILLPAQERAKAVGIEVPPDFASVTRIVTMLPGVALQDWYAWYTEKLAALAPGVYEVLVHPAYADEELRGITSGKANWGADWRQADLDLLRSPRFRRFLEEQRFVMGSWRQLAKAIPACAARHV
jgi:predicted glycoside hydrolase/deacetylase ChbG (UPF0249 family)